MSSYNSTRTEKLREILSLLEQILRPESGVDSIDKQFSAHELVVATLNSPEMQRDVESDSLREKIRELEGLLSSETKTTTSLSSDLGRLNQWLNDNGLGRAGRNVSEEVVKAAEQYRDSSELLRKELDAVNTELHEWLCNQELWQGVLGDRYSKVVIKTANKYNQERDEARKVLEAETETAKIFLQERNQALADKTAADAERDRLRLSNNDLKAQLNTTKGELARAENKAKVAETLTPRQVMRRVDEETGDTPSPAIVDLVEQAIKVKEIWDALPGSISVGEASSKEHFARQMLLTIANEIRSYDATPKLYTAVVRSILRFCRAWQENLGRERGDSDIRWADESAVVAGETLDDRILMYDEIRKFAAESGKELARSIHHKEQTLDAFRAIEQQGNVDLHLRKEDGLPSFRGM